MVIQRSFLRELTEKARQSPRLRMNHNLHPNLDSKAHRLLNAVEPGSYIPPHRHDDIEKDETFLLLEGDLGIIFFDDRGSVTETVRLTKGGEVVVVDVPHGVYHTAVSLASGTVFFEAKAGPFVPKSEQGTAPWAPPEGTPGTAAYLAEMRKLFS